MVSMAAYGYHSRYLYAFFLTLALHSLLLLHSFPFQKLNSTPKNRLLRTTVEVRNISGTQFPQIYKILMHKSGCGEVLLLLSYAIKLY